MEIPFISAFVEPANRSTAYDANATWPNVMPGEADIVSLWARGMLSNEDLGQIGGYHGMQFGPDNGFGPGSKPDKQQKLYFRAWSAVRNLHLNVPSAEDIYAGYTRGIINEASFSAMCLRSGVNESAHNQLLGLHRDWISPMQANALVLRGPQNGITEQDWDTAVSRSGGYSETQKGYLKKLRNLWPSASDLVHWGVREVFTPAIAEKLGQYNEFPSEIADIAHGAGLDWDMGVRVNTDKGNVPLTPIMAHWAAHWVPLSPGQAYQMLYRLRPDRIQRYKDIGINVTAFEMEDVKRHLRIADYPIGVRENLAAISYSVPNLRDIRGQFNAFIINETEAKDSLLDRGYMPQDADSIVKYWVLVRDESARKANELAQEKAERPTDRELDRLARRALRAYRLGTFDADQARFTMNRAGWTDDRQDIALAESDAALAEQLTTQIVADIRRDYLSGTITSAVAADALGQAGIRLARVNQYLAAWKLDRSFPHRAEQAAKVQDWYRKHYITRDQASERLHNLGFDQPDLLILMAEADREAALDDAKLMQAKGKAVKTAAREMEQLIRAKESALKKQRAELERLAPPSRLRVWLQTGAIGTDYFVRRMRALGFDESDIQSEVTTILLVAERAANKKAEASVRKTTNGTPQV